jgi:hypothetical protein
MIQERTTKILAGKVDPRYARAPVRLRRSVARVAWGLSLVALGWIGWSALTLRDHVYAPGPLSRAHAVVARGCADCHTSWQVVEDGKCAACHQKGIHHENQVLDGEPRAPRCASCHAEHKHRVSLVQVPDESCTQCHRHLKTSTGPTRFAAAITRFDAGHPEFAVIRDRRKDTARIKFGHAFHLQKGLKDVARFLRERGYTGVQAARDALACADCHRPDESGRLMQPIAYARHCASCHALEYDERFTGPAGGTDVVPHDPPSVVHGYLAGRYADYAAAHPGVVDPGGGDDAAAPRIPGRLRSLRSPIEWVADEVETRERGLLYTKRCAHCHDVEVAAPGTAPKAPFFARVKVLPTAIPARWLDHARFSHASHRPLTCLECHGGIPSSSRTEDVNLPSRDLCLKCHSEDRGAGFRSGCVECHVYHAAGGARSMEGTLKIRDLPKEKSIPSP